MKRIVFIGILNICFILAGIGQSLPLILEEVRLQNGNIHAMNLRVQAQSIKAQQVTQIPDPTFGAGVPILRPETRLGPQVASFGISQSLPWFGKLEAKQDLILLNTAYAKEEINKKELDIIADTKIAYHNLFRLTEIESIVKENIEIFKSIENIALSNVEAGKGSIADVLRLQVARKELESELSLLSFRKKPLVSRINELRNKPLDEEINIIEPDLFASMVGQMDPKINIDYPAFHQIEILKDISNQRLRINDLDNKPNITLGLDYIIVNERTDVFLDQNGRDILMPKFMMTLPINKTRQNLIAQEEQIKQESYELDRINREKEILTKITLYNSIYDEANIKIALKNNQIETLESSLKILSEKYSQQGSHFNDLLVIRKEIIRYNKDIVNAKIEGLNALANIEKFGLLK